MASIMAGGQTDSGTLASRAPVELCVARSAAADEGHPGRLPHEPDRNVPACPDRGGYEMSHPAPFLIYCIDLRWEKVEPDGWHRRQGGHDVTRLGVRRRSRQRIGAAALAGTIALLCLLLAPPAQAALGLQGLSAKPANIAAGAHSNVNIHIGFSDPADQVKDLTVHLPPGLVGDPTATPLCTVAQLNGDNCPNASEVGKVTAHVNVVPTPSLPNITVPLTVN